MQTWREALEKDAAAQQLLAERALFEIPARGRQTADVAKFRAEAIAADQETWLVEQERLAYQSAHAYQQQQIRSAIESKVSEVQHQVLNLLYRNLKKLSDKDYQPGKIPPRLKHQLEKLTESASILSHTDQSLAQVVEGG